LASLDFLCRRFIAAFWRLLEVLLICRIVLGLTLSWSHLLSTPSLISLLIYHAWNSATLIPSHIF
jgi:hypothetical protein